MPNYEHTPEKGAEPLPNLEQQKDSESLSNLKQQDIGATVLSLANFQDKHKSSVQKSFDKARREKESLPGDNNERRNLAYLKRLERIVEKGGDAAEKRLWELSKKRIHLVQTEDITESTWRSIQQDNRNHGGGNIELTDQLKDASAKEYRDVQADELESYIDYFASEDCPYPLWFKIYAWDGLTSLSRNVKTSNDGFPVLQKRDKTTTSGFPKLNPAALAKVYDGVTKIWGLPTDAKEANHSDAETDDVLKRIVKSGSFAKVYSYELSKLTQPIEVPDKTEDIHGSWIEYDLSNVEDLSSAAEGTPWCIVSPSTAKNYLKYGSYGAGGSEYYNGDQNEARFYLFHLEDPTTGLPSKQACASIRLDPDGKVAEVSGILDGSKQRLNDSLLPIVKEKCDQLPGGERKYQAFLDNEHLVQIDEKIKNNEPLAADDFYFIFETDRDIEQLNDYNRDSRIVEFRDYMLEKDKLLAAGADVNKLVSRLNSDDIADNLDKLLAAGVDVNKLVPKLNSRVIARNFDKLIAAGADIDINEHIPKLDSRTIAWILDKLLAAGADVNELVSKLNSYYIAWDLDKLLAAGADVNELVSKLDSYDIARNLDKLLAAGADVNELVSKLNSYYIAWDLDKLLTAGADIDINEHIPKLDSRTIAWNLDKLLAAGADVNKLVSRLNSDDIADNLDKLIAAGADIN